MNQELMRYYRGCSELQFLLTVLSYVEEMQFGKLSFCNLLKTVSFKLNQLIVM